MASPSIYTPSLFAKNFDALPKIYRYAKDSLSPKELEEWRAGVAWENELDMQKELRLRREAVFWKDPTLVDLDEQSRMWEILQMGFQQVEDILDGANLGHYYDYLLAKGFFYGARMRGMSRKFLEEKMPAITDAYEKELILDACANACRDEAIRLFPFRYGNPETLLHECHEGRRFLDEKFTQGWFEDTFLLTYPLAVNAHETAHQLPEKDRLSMDECDFLVAGADTTGRVYLFPQTDSADSKVPPCIRNAQIHQGSVLDLAVDWESMRSVSVGLGGKLVIYDHTKDMPLETLHVGSACGLPPQNDFWSALHADFQLGKLATGLSSGHLQLVDLETSKPVHMIPGHAAMVRRVAADWNVNELVSCSYDGFLKLTDARTTKPIRELKGKGQWDAMDVSFDQQLVLATSRFDFATMLWDLRSGEVIREYELPGHCPNTINVDWCTMTACTGADDGKVKIWQLETGEVSQTIDCEHFLTQSLDICWSRGLLLTGSFDHQFKLWDVTSGTLLKQFVEPKRCLTRVLLQLAI